MERNPILSVHTAQQEIMVMHLFIEPHCDPTLQVYSQVPLIKSYFIISKTFQHILLQSIFHLAMFYVPVPYYGV